MRAGPLLLALAALSVLAPPALRAQNSRAPGADLIGRDPLEHYFASIEEWRAGRIARLQKPDGWLALIGRHPLEHGTWTVGSAAENSIRLAAGPARLGTITYADDGKVSFALADGVDATIDGTKERAAALALEPEHPTYVRAGTVNFYVMQRSGKLFLRVRDSESPRLKHFTRIEHYPVELAWRVEARWVPFDPPREYTITTIMGLQEPATIPGKAVFEHDGKTYELVAIDEGPDEDLFFVLTDTTAGSETYEASRFLYAKRPVNGVVILDFNKLYNPPCAFTPFATCPMPPKGNALPFPIRAGERKYEGPH